MLSSQGKIKIIKLKDELFKQLQDIKNDEKKFDETKDDLEYKHLQNKRGNKSNITYVKNAMKHGILLISFIEEDEKRLPDILDWYHRILKNKEEKVINTLLKEVISRNEILSKNIKKLTDINMLSTETNFQKLLSEYKKSISKTTRDFDLSCILKKHGFDYISGITLENFQKIVEFFLKHGFHKWQEHLTIAFIMTKMNDIFPDEYGFITISNEYSRNLAQTLYTLYSEFKPETDLNGIYQLIPGIATAIKNFSSRIKLRIKLFDTIKQSKSASEQFNQIQYEITAATKSFGKALAVTGPFDFKDFEINYNKEAHLWLHALKTFPSIDLSLNPGTRFIDPFQISFKKTTSAKALTTSLLSFEKQINHILKVKNHPAITTILDTIHSIYHSPKNQAESKSYQQLIYKTWQNLIGDQEIHNALNFKVFFSFIKAKAPEQMQRESAATTIIHELKEAKCSHPLEILKLIRQADIKLSKLKFNYRNQQYLAHEIKLLHLLEKYFLQFIRLILQHKHHYLAPPQELDDYIEWLKKPRDHLILDQYKADLNEWIIILKNIQANLEIFKEIPSDPATEFESPEYNPKFLMKINSILCFFSNPPLKNISQFSRLIEKLFAEACTLQKALLTATSHAMTEQLGTYFEKTKTERNILNKVNEMLTDFRMNDLTSPSVSHFRRSASTPAALFQLPQKTFRNHSEKSLLIRKFSHSNKSTD